MDVSSILEAHKAKNKLPTIEKLVPVEFDLNLLAGFDPNAFDEERLKAQTDSYLKELTQENTQLILNQILKLPTSSTDSGIVTNLPLRITKLPREKTLPKDKPLTRWEKFAKAKGIQNRKRERMVYDEDRQEYVPRWGYKPGERKGDWLVEVPGNADPMEDQFAKKREEKKERIERNNKRQKRNTEESSATLAAGKKDVRDIAKSDIKAAIAASQAATASMGKFDQPPKEFKSKPKGSPKKGAKPKSKSRK